MDSESIPFKTAQGQAEIARRELGLSQRHRTVLLLIDGRRSSAEVRRLAVAAGAAGSLFDELINRGLVALPDATMSAQFAGVAPTPLAVTVPTPLAEMAAAPDAYRSVSSLAALAPRTRVDPALPKPQAGSDLSAGARHDDDSAGLDDTLLPTAGTLQPESQLTESPAPDVPAADTSAFGELEEVSRSVAATDVDRPLEAAREVLLRAVRAEAPLAGSLTMIRLRRACNRAELTALLPEVEQRISKPQRHLVAQQTLSHVRQLLMTPA